mgnify:CR=1 FL=1
MANDMAKRDLLIELGTEELPPKALPDLSAALTEELVRQLDDAGLAPGAVESFAAPRRLAVLVRDLADELEATFSPRRLTSCRFPNACAGGAARCSSCARCTGWWRCTVAT